MVGKALVQVAAQIPLCGKRKDKPNLLFKRRISVTGRVPIDAMIKVQLLFRQKQSHDDQLPTVFDALWVS